MHSLALEKHMRTRIIILGCCLIAGILLDPSTAHAQATPPPAKIVGIVVDAQTGRPLPGAQASVVERHLGDPAHADGSFQFRNLAAGTYTLTVDHIGYDRHTQKVTLAAGETEDVRVELHVRAIQLEEIVVTGSITQRAGRDVLSPVSVVRSGELDRVLEPTVAATLETKPGIAVTSIGPTTGRPVIRGLSGDRILVLEDGARVGDMSAMPGGDHAIAIDPFTAQQLEVVRGPMSLLYGSSALGGVINVVRQEIPGSMPEHTHGSLTAQGSSVSRGINGGGYVNQKVGSFATRFEASARASGEVRTPVGRLENTSAQNFNLAAAGSYIAPWGHTGASYRFYDNDYGIPGGFVGGHETGVDIKMRRHTARGELELHRGENDLLSTIKATVAYNDYHHQELEPSGSVGTEFFQNMVAGEVVARHGRRGVLDQGAIGFRGQYRDIITGGSLRTPSTYDYNFAGFIVEEIGRGQLRLQAGARYDWTHYVPRDTTAFISVGGQRIPVRPRTFGSVSGSLGLLYAPGDDLRVGVSVARAYRTPDFNELYSNGPHLAANSFEVGDPSLDSETGLGFDAFVRLSTARVRGEVAAFRNQLDGYIFSSSRGRAEIGTQGGRPRFQFTNEDAVFTGAEADLAFSLTDRLVLEGTASYVRARFTSDRAPIPIINPTDTTFVPASKYAPLIPPLNGNVGLRYDHQRFFAGAAMRWAAAQNNLGDFETKTDSYAIGNLSAGIRIPQGDRFHTITLTIDNVLDTEYRDHLSRIKEIMPQPGRNIGIMYRVTF
jgi:iron complex outermembrane receptor protein